MGADLYLHSIYDKNYDKWNPVFEAAVKSRDSFPHGSPQAKAFQDEVNLAYSRMYTEDGYFRDSYNNSSVLWRLGLSWWSDIIPMCEKGMLSPKKAKRLRSMIEKRPLALPTEEDLKSWGGEDSIEEWASYFTQKKGQLIAFLTRAIVLDEPIDCSL